MHTCTRKFPCGSSRPPRQFWRHTHWDNCILNWTAKKLWYYRKLSWIVENYNYFSYLSGQSFRQNGYLQICLAEAAICYLFCTNATNNVAIFALINRRCGRIQANGAFEGFAQSGCRGSIGFLKVKILINEMQSFLLLHTCSDSFVQQKLNKLCIH